PSTASAAARMVSASNGRPIIEMGSRRTHERAAVAAARAAYLAGFASTSNLAARVGYGIPTRGTASLGHDTTLLIDTYDTPRGIERAIAAAGPDLGAVRIDSGDLGVMARHAR